MPSLRTRRVLSLLCFTKMTCQCFKRDKIKYILLEKGKNKITRPANSTLNSKVPQFSRFSRSSEKCSFKNTFSRTSTPSKCRPSLRRGNHIRIRYSRKVLVANCHSHLGSNWTFSRGVRFSRFFFLQHVLLLLLARRVDSRGRQWQRSNAVSFACVLRQKNSVTWD